MTDLSEVFFFWYTFEKGIIYDFLMSHEKIMLKWIRVKFIDSKYNRMISRLGCCNSSNFSWFIKQHMPDQDFLMDFMDGRKLIRKI
jgi:hypothetical protein